MRYKTPTIKTLKAEEIVESMGPVSCGSGTYATTPTPADLGFSNSVPDPTGRRELD